MTYPIPSDALDDRLAWTGMAGTGKTHNSGTAIERVLKAGSRVCIPDPLGVWWGLRLRQDGVTASKFKVVIFGGPHGDLGLTETSGKLIGETVAGMAESCILDLSDFDTEAAQRRFMLAFIVALYGGLKDQLLHVVFDEADMWAPQQIRDKEGDATKLHHHMQKLVRRGRVKGFIPWLITQRPAELSKSVLSQVDGIVAHQLVAPQDMNAIMDWVGARADKAAAETIRTRMPAFERGEAVVYIPRRRVLSLGRFPLKATFDSSKAPDRGERTNRPDVALKPVDISALQNRLEKVEAEAKANDPVRLKGRIAELERELRQKPAAAAPTAKPDPVALAEAEKRGYARGVSFVRTHVLGRPLADLIKAENAISDQVARLNGARESIVSLFSAPVEAPPATRMPAGPSAQPDLPSETPPPGPRPVQVRPAREAVETGQLSLSRQKIIDAIAWLEAMGSAPSREAIAFVAGVPHTSGGYKNNLGALRSSGLVEYPDSGRVTLTTEGAALAAQPERAPTHLALMARVQALLGPGSSLSRLIDRAAAIYPDAIAREALAADVGVPATSGGFKNNLGRLRTLGLITYPSTGNVRAADVLFPERQ